MLSLPTSEVEIFCIVPKSVFVNDAKLRLTILSSILCLVLLMMVVVILA